MTTEITYGAFKLLKAMVAGDTLRDRLMGCSRHQNYAVHDSAGRDRHVADHTAQQLIDARFIEPTGKDYRTYRYTEYPDV